MSNISPGFPPCDGLGKRHKSIYFLICQPLEVVLFSENLEIPEISSPVSFGISTQPLEVVLFSENLEIPEISSPVSFGISTRYDSFS